MIQHPRVQPEQDGKAQDLAVRRSWPQATATCWATSWVPSGFLMVIDLLSGKRKVASNKPVFESEALAPEHSSISQFPGSVFPPPLCPIQS